MPCVLTAGGGTSTYALQSAFEKTEASIKCPECKTMLHMRVAEVVRDWSAVRVSGALHTAPPADCPLLAFYLNQVTRSLRLNGSRNALQGSAVTLQK